MTGLAILFGLGLLATLAAAPMLFILLWTRQSSLRERLARAEARIEELEVRRSEPAMTARPEPRPEPEPAMEAGPTPEVPPPTTPPPPPQRAAARVIRSPAVKVPPGEAVGAEATAPDARRPEPPEPPEPGSFAPPPHAAPAATLSERFEALVGGRLPVWIGGIALVFAAIFLVRYSVEAGLLGPAARVVLATLFGVGLVVLAVVGGRLPRVGSALAEEPRLAQALAGAGVAILYGTLYMASQLYGLIGLGSAFAGVIGVTALAFALSLRFGMPTAIMGLVGGFAAPWVAGLTAGEVTPLLLYLGIFTVALFGLALWRGWLWLALAATGGSALWTIVLLIVRPGDAGPVGLLIALLAAAGMLVAARLGDRARQAGWVAPLPLAVGLVQLAVAAPTQGFGALEQAYVLALAALSLTLAVARPALITVMLAGLALAGAALLHAAILSVPTRPPVAALIAYALLFAGAGHAMLTRFAHGGDARQRSGWALAALAAPVLAALCLPLGDGPIPNGPSFLAGAAAALAAGWRLRSDGLARGALGRLEAAAVAIAIIMAILALEDMVGMPWLGLAVALLSFGPALWFARRGAGALTIVTFALGLILLVPPTAGVGEAALASLVGETDLFALLPPLWPALPLIAGAGGVAAALAAVPRLSLADGARRGMGIVAAVLVVVTVWLVWKQLFQIGPALRFEQVGYLERALFTHALLGVGGVLLWRQSGGWLRAVAFGLAAAGLLRILWFDVLLLNPLAVAQALGPAPVANLGTVSFALAAFWLWRFAALPEADRRGLVQPLRIGTLAAMTLATVIAVRQGVHGSIVAGMPLGQGENLLLSGALLLLGVGWLGCGMRGGSRLLRVAGLAMLTVVTLKVFLADAAALEGLLRVASFLGLGIALMGIGWLYGRVMRRAAASADAPLSPDLPSG